MNEQTMYFAIGAGLVGIFYYYRAERLRREKKAQSNIASTPATAPYSSKFPFTSMKTQFYDPSVWKINEPGYAREGQYGLERRDYVLPVGGTQVVTHTDQYVNV